MIEIYNFNDASLSDRDGSYGGAAGAKDGVFLFEKEHWIIKKPKNLSAMQGNNIASYSSSALSEYLGSHIYELLGFETHTTLLCERDGKLCVACKDFVDENSILLEIRTLKNKTTAEMGDLADILSSSQTHIVDLRELFFHLDENPLLSQIPDIKVHFFKQLITDVLINNNDRNSGNWGLVRNKTTHELKIAPIFDNGSCFLPKASEQKITNLINDNLVNYSINCQTVYGENEKVFFAPKLLDRIKTHSEYKIALKEIVPKIISQRHNINSLFGEIPKEYTLSSGEAIEVLSDNRKYMYYEGLNIRLEKLLYPEYLKIIEKNIEFNEYTKIVDFITNDKSPVAEIIALAKNNLELKPLASDNIAKRIIVAKELKNQEKLSLLKKELDYLR